MSNFKATFLYLIFFIFVLLTRKLALVNGNAVPALYVFGDSTVDSGNNNYLQTRAKANFLPFGIDFINPATGRFTNGRTIADCIADMLGLPFAPPYLGLSEFERSKVVTGMNYASAACGILPLSGSKAGTCLSMDNQTEYFMSTIEKDLPTIISNSQEVTLHLSQSIFLVSIGVNDYTTNYLINFKGTWTGYTPEAFGDFLLNEFFIRMQRLYHLGARKFVVNAAYPVGWAPYYVGNGTRAKEINQQIQYFTTRVPQRLQELQSKFADFLFTVLDHFKIFEKLISTPEIYGFADVRRPCCPADGKATSFCEPNMAVCEDRKKYMFFDGGHTTESANGILAQECFSGTICKPNIIELVKAP